MRLSVSERILFQVIKVSADHDNLVKLLSLAPKKRFALLFLGGMQKSQGRLVYMQIHFVVL